MKRLLLFIFTILMFGHSKGQHISIKEFLSLTSYTSKKFENYLSKNKYKLGNKSFRDEILVNTYYLRTKKKWDETPRATTMIETYQKGKSFSFSFSTSSPDEYRDAKKELKQEGFFCGNEDDSGSASSLFQRRNISVLISKEDTIYSFRFHQEMLPPPASIHYAEDLLQFTSHEYLVSVFGEKNVLKDLYYFSDKTLVKCSMLFPHTPRQAVFIWKDGANLCDLSNLIIGGNMPTASSAKYDDVIGENLWMSKDGIYSGMSLSSLARLNGNDFKFYGINAVSPLAVVPENTGKINFKKKAVVLGCLNPYGSQLLNNKMVSSDEVTYDNPGLFVFMIMLSPATVKIQEQ